jgi:hypothetical protein
LAACGAGFCFFAAATAAFAASMTETPRTPAKSFMARSFIAFVDA